MGKKWPYDEIPDEFVIGDGRYVPVFDRDGVWTVGPVDNADKLHGDETE